jgi:transcriptional regulator with XRE-family HTH domain
MSARIERLMLELTAAIREEMAQVPEGVGTLGEEIARARSAARLSLQEVADRSGFTKSHVWELEQGRTRNPTIGMVAGLSRALGVSFQRLAQAALNGLNARPAPKTPPSGTNEAASAAHAAPVERQPREAKP